MADTRRVSSRLRLLIAEDQYLTREGTRRLLEDRDELEVVGVASDLGSVLAEARRPPNPVRGRRICQSRPLSRVTLSDA